MTKMGKNMCLLMVTFLMTVSVYAEDTTKNTQMPPKPMEMGAKKDMQKPALPAMMGSGMKLPPMMGSGMPIPRPMDNDGSGKLERPGMPMMGSGMKLPPMVGSGMMMGSGMKMPEMMGSGKMENNGQMEALFKNLPEDVKAKIKTLQDQLNKDVQAVYEELKTVKTDEVKTKALIQKMGDLKKAHEDAMKVLLSSVPGFTTAPMGKKEDMKTQSGAMMKPEAKKPAQNPQPTQKEKVGKYKESFTKTLGAKLNTIPTENLKVIGTKIDTLIEQYTNNTNLTPEKKENFVSQLQALKEIINEKISPAPATDALDIDSIFNVK